MKKSKLYWQLFLSTFQLSAFTFGGGFVIIPLMREKFVEKLHWLEEEEMLDLTAIAQSAPGAIAVNASILVGYRVAGVLGALTTVAGTVLPPLITLSVISYFYAAFRSNHFVSLVMKGMGAGVVAVIFNVVLTMGRAVLKEKRLLYLAVLLGAFAAAFFYKVNVIFIILTCGFLGAADILHREYRKGARSA